jgi:DNA polymerase III subunit alpha
MSNHFVHLHLHTEYSLLDGAIKLPQLFDFSKKQNWKSIAITDHGNVFGAVKFFQLAKKNGIKPILGCEFYFVPDANIKSVDEKYYHLTVLVKNEVGYKNLCRLMALSFKEGFYFKPRIDCAMIEKYNEGLLFGSACLGGYIPQMLLKKNITKAESHIDWILKTLGNDRFFLEVMPVYQEEQKIVNDLLFEYGKKYNIDCVATNDAHYLTPEDKDAHEVLLAIQTKHLMTDAKRMTFGDLKAHLHTTEEMLTEFKDHEEVVWNTGKIADQCNFEFEFGKLFFPQFPIPKDHTENSFFEKLCWDGLEKLKQNNLIPPKELENYNKRLQIEIDLIEKMGYVGYFLVVSDFIQWSKQQLIPVGPGRGSAAGSLVAWAMEITNVDPLKYNLLFERFLNPERVSMPDIDIDFCIEQREDVINYVKEKYGHDCVCQIITFGTMMAKGVIKDVARALGFPFQDSNALTDLIPDQLKISLNEAIEQEPRLKSMIEGNQQVKNLFDLCFRLEGLTRHASKHAAGVVISPEPLHEMLPLLVPSKTDEMVTQYAMTELEGIGFLKMDFLGLKNLTVVGRALATIKKRHGVEINLDTLALDDVKAFDLLRAGKTNGVFQFESDGIKDVMIKLQPQRFEDLIAVNALYRPGPLGSGMVDDFIDRKHGRKVTTYMFAELEPILSETYGVIVYQEQVMKIASAIAGYSLGGADLLRRAMGKKKVEVMEEQKFIFIKGASELGHDAKKAAELFDLMAYFAGYGFNKSHSTAYALIAYHTAYLKANYPAEFMAALVSFETDNPDKLTFYLQEINDLGIKTISPDINRSEIEFSAQDDGILFGLKGIKNVGKTALEQIITEREKKPFWDLLDFCTRVDLRTVNKRVIENLIYAGAFDKLSGNRAQKISELEKVIAHALQAKETARTGQMGLFSAPKKKSDDPEPYEFQPLDEWSDKKKLEKEKEVAGFYLSSHPLQTYDHMLKHLKLESIKSASEKIESYSGKREPSITCCGLQQTYKVINTKKGDRMAFAQYEDLTGKAEIIIFPRLFAKVEKWLADYTVFIVKGNLDLEATNKCKIKAQELVPVELIGSEWSAIENMKMILPKNINEEAVKEIIETLPPGPIPLHILFEENGDPLLLRSHKKIRCSFENFQTLSKLGINFQLSL